MVVFSEPPISAEHHSKHVLAVDDDPVVLEVLREWLEAIGHRVTTRDQELGTCEWILMNEPDFVVLDLQMPALNGSEIAGLLHRRGIHHRTGIILYSGAAPSELSRVAVETGALGAISKDASEHQFITEFRNLTRQHDPRLNEQ